MASKGTISGPYFFIFDFYVMTGADDSNDVLPKAVLYFYSTDDQTKEQVNIIIYSKISFFFSFFFQI